MVVVHLTHRTAYANSSDDFTRPCKHRRRNTTHADSVLFIIDRVTTPANRGEIFQQMRKRNDRSRRDGSHRVQPRDLLHLFATQLADQRFTNGRHLWRDATSVPNIHFDKTRRLDAFDVDRLAVIEYGQVRTQTRGLDDLSQVGHGELAQGHALHRLTAKTQHAY